MQSPTNYFINKLRAVHNQQIDTIILCYIGTRLEARSGMYTRIPHLLSESDLAAIENLLSRADWVDGRVSAGAQAGQVKHNQEVAHHSVVRDELNAIVMGRLVSHPDYQAVALPHKVAEPFYVRYGEGGDYGDHTDNPIMGESPHCYRSDLAITIFLNEPDQYDGGELLIGTLAGEISHRLKYPAGDAIIYPAATSHRVEPLRRGQRWVAITWVQSLIRDSAQRELVYRLGKVRDRIVTAAPSSDEAQQLEWLYANLIRQWAQP